MIRVNQENKDDSARREYIPVEANVTEQQKTAILFHADPNKINSIVAGPGCGKTQALVYRIAHLLSQGINPSEILVLSLTNMSVHNIRSKLNAIMETDGNNSEISEEVHISTFHGFANKALNEALPGTKFHIIDKICWKTISNMISQKGIDEFIVEELFDELKLTNAFKENINIDALVEQYRMRDEPLVLKRQPSKESKRFTLNNTQFEQIIRKLNSSGLVTFNDIMFHFVSMLKAKPEIINNNYKAIFIDEFQDITPKLFPLIKALFNSDCHITVAGDPTQSIYGFLGSHEVHESMAQFLKPDSAKQIHETALTCCFRSTKSLVKFSNNFTPMRLQKYEFHNSNEMNDNDQFAPPPIIKVFDLTYSEHDFVCHEIKKILEKCEGIVKPSDIAVLSRSNAGLSKFKVAADFYGIKTRKNTSLPAWMLTSAVHLIDILKMFEDPDTNEFSVLSCLLSVYRIGPQVINDIIKKSIAMNITVWQYLQTLEQRKIIWKFVKEAEKRIEFYRDSQNSNFANDPNYILKDILNFLTETNSYTKLFNVDVKKQNCRQELAGILQDFYESLTRAALTRKDESLLLWFISSYNEKQINPEVKSVDTIHPVPNENENNKHAATMESDYVHISTVHAAKGLEYPIVFILGGKLQFDILFDKTTTPTETSIHLNRLFYVAITRARLYLYICMQNEQGKLPALSDEITNTFAFQQPQLDLKAVQSIGKLLGRKSLLSNLKTPGTYEGEGGSGNQVRHLSTWSRTKQNKTVGVRYIGTALHNNYAKGYSCNWLTKVRTLRVISKLAIKC